MELEFKLQVFEGPLDLLLHLIDKNKIDIYDIPIAEITDQYMDYLSSMEETDLDVMSDFLVMASTLLDIKSQMLLPRQKDENGEETDPRQELVDQLLQYKMYKYMSQELKDRQVDAGRVLYKKPSVPEEVAAYEQPVDMEALIGDLTLEGLNCIFQDVMRKQEDKMDPVRGRFGTIRQEEVTVSDQLEYVTDYARTHATFSFRHLLEKSHSRTQVVVTFLAVLELMKSGTIRAEQAAPFEEIMITSQQSDQSEQKGSEQIHGN